jgi:hypothetical protein
MIVLINNVDKTSTLMDTTLDTGLNGLPSFQFTTTFAVKINDTIKVTDGARVIFNGIINTNPIIDYDTNIYTALASGNIIKLDNIRSNSRRKWTNENANVIIPAVVGNVFTIGSVDSFSPLTIVDEFASPLLVVLKTALACRADMASPVKVNNNVISSYDFWVDEDTDLFYFKSYRGNLTPVASYTINSNIWGVVKQNNLTQVVNSIVLTGAGDGVNQIVRHASNLYCPILNSLAASGDLTIQLSDDDYASSAIAKNLYTVSLPSGTGFKIRIDNEIMGVTTRNDGAKTLTVLSANRGLDSTSLASHTAGANIYGGSVLEHGLRQKTLYDRSVIDSDTGYQIASSGVYELSTNKETLTFNISSLGFWLGDVITINSVQYRVLNISHKLLKGYYTITVGYISRGQVTLYEDMITKLQDGATYMQGATNMYMVQGNDNCDISHPLQIKFYIPPEAVKINHVKLNFTLENFRAYSKSLSEAGLTVGTTVSSTHDHGGNTELNGNFYTDNDSHDHYIDRTDFRIMDYANSHGDYLGSDGEGVPPWAHWTKYSVKNSAGSIYYIWLNSEDNLYSDLYLFDSGYSSSESHDHYVSDMHAHGLGITDGGSHSHGVTIPAHSHNIDYGIYEEILSSPSVTVQINAATLGTYTTNQNDLDIGSYISSSGWYTITFTPNKNIRINANIYIQIYLESK